MPPNPVKLNVRQCTSMVEVVLQHQPLSPETRRGRPSPRGLVGVNLQNRGPKRSGPGDFEARRWLWGLVSVLLWANCQALFAADAALRVSVYATAGDVERYLAPPEQRNRLLEALRPLQVSRMFLEGRRGDEYVSPAVLREVRDFLSAHGIRSSGGIATVPGASFGVRQQGPLSWLNWQSAKTQRDVASFFTENAPVFSELIVDDFYCTADISSESEQARGQRSWGEYRRDLLVGLVGPMILEPVRHASRDARLIVKFPQWYDRFHLFGYDPPRLAAAFDQVWVGTEVRDPKTRRMGHVQPTEGYMNFRWLSSIAGPKTTGAWFDHIECSAQNFVDQAFLSVLAGARELTLFRLGDLMEGHPGDALLARRLPELLDLAAKAHASQPAGVAFYKPPNSDADDNLYLADYLGMIGLPILPVAHYTSNNPVVFLPAQAATDNGALAKARQHLRRGATLVMTPAFIRRAGEDAAKLAGIRVSLSTAPTTTSRIGKGRRECPLAVPVEVDGGLEPAGARVRLSAKPAGAAVPLLTERKHGRGRVLVLNVRTFSEDDFRSVGEWLLSPLPRGLPEVPQEVADALRAELLSPLRCRLTGPSGVALCLFENARCLYNFRPEPVQVRLDGKLMELRAHGWRWIEDR